MRADAAPAETVWITLAHDTDLETRTQAQLAALLVAHDVERYLHTRAVMIDEDAIPHSHPVLTLHARHLDDDGLLLSTFLHEQLHWFVVAHPEARDAAVAELRERFPDLPVGYPDGASDEQSSYEHLIVNHLERLAVGAVLGKAEAERTQSFWRTDHYRALYLLEQTHEADIHAILEHHGLLHPDPRDVVVVAHDHSPDRRSRRRGQVHLRAHPASPAPRGALGAR